MVYAGRIERCFAGAGNAGCDPKRVREGGLTNFCHRLGFILRERQKQNGPHFLKARAAGGLFGIDQEVVTLRGPFGKLRVPAQHQRRADPTLTHRCSCEVCIAERSTKRPEMRLRATALSLSHLTWSTTMTTIRTCHPTTSFPV